MQTLKKCLTMVTIVAVAEALKGVEVSVDVKTIKIAWFQMTSKQLKSDAMKFLLKLLKECGKLQLQG